MSKAPAEAKAPIPVEDVSESFSFDTLPILPTRGVVVFPYMMTPLVISDQRYAKLIDEALMGGKTIGLFAQLDPEVENPGPEELYTVGCAGQIVKMLRFPDGSVRFLVQGQARINMGNVERTEPYIVARVEEIHVPEAAEKTVEIEALTRNLNEQVKSIVQLAPYLTEDLHVTAMNTDEPSRLADLIATSLNLSSQEKQEILETIPVQERLELVTRRIHKEVEVLELSRKIQSEAAHEMGKSQREYILREQLKVIQKELGEGDERQREYEEYQEKIEAAAMPELAQEAALKELDRLQKMHPSAAEYTVARTYLDWLVDIPWSATSIDAIDIKRSRKVLDEDHYDLEKVKDRILEYLAVRKLKPDTKSPILCFVGPPGVGKTSLGKSIARSMGRKFERISLGGMHDEAEIRGHRRTYIGALPGRIIQSIKRAGTNNPIFMLDEIDKVGKDFRGDPASALLEVLDPEQNNSFGDHYLDVPFDLSKVIFITTANVLYAIPDVLRDRMEVIELPGYTDYDKVHIARQFLMPRQLENHGLNPSALKMSDTVLQQLINEYTREAGLRNFERQIATICRKVAMKVASEEARRVRVTSKNLPEFLGPLKFFREVDRAPRVGVVPGLAWTPTGGEILFVEASRMKGKRGLTLTGNLGDVMRESVQAALSYLRAHAEEFDIEPDFFETSDLHIHVPSGAIPKDGPSAGVTMATALASLLTGRRPQPKLAMTGEINLSGDVMPIGGLKEKSLAAHRAGIQTVIIPAQNEKDLVEIPKEVRDELEFIAVGSVHSAIDAALAPAKPAKSAVRKRKAAPRPRRVTSKSRGRRK
jgi:ATP-dependent Lon protease